MKRSLHGFTLVEVLVALVVLSVGMLGIAGLYITSLRAGSGSIFRMQAVSLASDIADRIRANRTANVAYNAGAAAANCIGSANNCAPAQMAGNDLFVWQQQIANILPSGAGTVAVAGPAAGLYTYTIQVTWNEPAETAPLRYRVDFQL